jgi:DNA-binding transcriptional MerR regulator
MEQTLLLQEILRALQDNNAELRQIRALLETQNREGLMVPPPLSETVERSQPSDLAQLNAELADLFGGEVRQY